MTSTAIAPLAADWTMSELPEQVGEFTLTNTGWVGSAPDFAYVAVLCTFEAEYSVHLTWDSSEYFTVSVAEVVPDEDFAYFDYREVSPSVIDLPDRVHYTAAFDLMATTR